MNDAINSIETKTILYCYSNSFLPSSAPLTPDKAGSKEWYVSIPIEEGKYLWQTTRIESSITEPTYTTPICLTQPKISNIYEEFIQTFIEHGFNNREKQLKRWHRDWKINLIKEMNPTFKDLSLEWE